MEIVTLILAGGKGTRLSEETHLIPKPMVEIGGKPIVQHIMTQISSFGIEKFVILTGHKGALIRNWVSNLKVQMSDVQIDLRSGVLSILEKTRNEDLNVVIRTLDTGQESQTGKRISLAISQIPADLYLMTYGDVIGNVDIQKLVKSHLDSKKLATVTGVRPTPRFGTLQLAGQTVTSFQEKSIQTEDLINGGYFILSKGVLDFIHEDESFEFSSLPRLVESSQLNCYLHDGFWHPMDTLRDKNSLEELARNLPAPWELP